MYSVKTFKDLEHSFPESNNSEYKFFLDKENAIKYFQEELINAKEYFQEPGTIDGEYKEEIENEYFNLSDNTSSWTCSIENLIFEDKEDDEIIAKIIWTTEAFKDALHLKGFNECNDNVEILLNTDIKSILEDKCTEKGNEIIEELIDDLGGGLEDL